MWRTAIVALSLDYVEKNFKLVESMNCYRLHMERDGTVLVIISIISMVLEFYMLNQVKEYRWSK